MVAIRLFAVVLTLPAIAAASSGGATRNPAVAWEDLPLIRSGVKVRAYTSYNPTGRTYRDFMNYTRRDGQEYELALHRGCGMLVQLWSTSIGDLFGTGQFGNVRMYLSDDDKPDTDLPWDAQYTQSDFPHIPPLWNKAYAARWGFPCLRFDERFKATSTDMPHWYQFTCHVYREPRFSEAMKTDQIVAWNAKIAREPGTFPGEDPGRRKETRYVSLPSAGRATLFARTGPGVVRSLRLKASDTSSAVLDRVRVRIQVDTLDEPAVHVPLSIFFGGYIDSPIDRAKGLPCGYDGRQLYFYFPMPFWQSMRVELENTSGREITVDSDIGWSETNPYPRDAAGVFRVQYNDGVTVEKGKPDFGHLNVRGSGHIVGASANLAGSIEGNFRTYIDGSHTPAIETTGGEDYFCHAFGIRVGLLTPFHGGLNDKIGYRFHLCDYVPFLSEVCFGQDHAHGFTHDRDGTFRSAVFYYWNPVPGLTLTDELDVGNEQSEKEHAYEITGRRARMQTDEAAYEGNFDAIIRDSGRWTEGATTFRVRIDPNNDGIRLRKRINQLSYHQAVDVSVDGRPVGLWFEQGSQYRLFEEKPGSRDYQPEGYRPNWNHIDKRFRDTEFEIPASFTRGKSSIVLTMTTRGAESALDQNDQGLTNEYHYWVYSYRTVGNQR